MKILIVNTHDIGGGAARAAYRLHQALVKLGANSQMLVINKSGDNNSVLKPLIFVSLRYRIKRFFIRLRKQYNNPLKKYPNKTKTLFNTSSNATKNIIDTINRINPDIVHLHWICGEMIDIEDLKKIKVPIVWSLHDMWAFTGGCHYDEECGRYTMNCGQCKVLGSTNKYDLSSIVFQRKEKTFSQLDNLTIIGLSNWMSSCVKESTLLKQKNTVTLPNLIDSKTFQPINKKLAREMLSFPFDKKLILFGSVGVTSDPRKGFKELSGALHKLKSKNIELIFFGSSLVKECHEFRFKAHYLGHLHDDVSLAILYSAVDVMVVPSLQENLSNVIMESLSCSTPVVGFSVGGNRDMIEHKKTGYLAIPFDLEDLAKGIDWILNTENYNNLCENARVKVLNEFDSNIIVKKYLALYKAILGKHDISDYRTR